MKGDEESEGRRLKERAISLETGDVRGWSDGTGGSAAGFPP